MELLCTSWRVTSTVAVVNMLTTFIRHHAQLFAYLFSRETLVCGTVRSNRRGLPEQTSGLQRGEAVFIKKELSHLFTGWISEMHGACPHFMVITWYHTQQGDEC